MFDVFMNMLPSAIGVAISPIPIVAVILMLMGKHAKSNGPAFLGGWILALLIVSGFILWLAGAGKLSSGGSSSSATTTITLILGLLMIALGIKSWLGRPKGSEQPPMPKWMAAIDGFTPIMSFGIAIVLAALNPKNLLLVIAGSLAIVDGNLAAADQLLLVIVFVIIGSLTVAVPVIYYLLAPTSAAAMLDTAKGWLVRYNSVIMAVLLIVIGAKLLIQSLA